MKYFLTLILMTCSLLAKADQCSETKILEKQFSANELKQVQLKRPPQWWMISA